MNDQSVCVCQTILGAVEFDNQKHLLGEVLGP